MRFWLMAFLGAVPPAIAQAQSLTVTHNGTPLPGNVLPLVYNTNRPNLTTLTGTPQLIVINSTPSTGISITPSGNWLRYVVVGPAVTDCSNVPLGSYLSPPVGFNTSTPARVCVAAAETNPALNPGYYPGALIVASASSKLIVSIQLSVFPTGYLQLSSPYPTSFNGQTVSFPFNMGTPQPATVHVNVLDDNTVNLTPDDNNDQKASLGYTIQSEDGSPANWVIVTLTDVKQPTLPTSKSPALLHINVDPSQVPLGQQTVTATITISSQNTPFKGTDFVRVTATLPQVTNKMSTDVSNITFSFPGGAPTRNVNVGSTINGARFNASASTTDGKNWLSVSPASGSTPASVAVTATVSASQQPGTYTGSIKFTALDANASPPPDILVELDLTGLTRTLAHVADLNGFKTTFLLTNPDTAPAAYTMRVYDESGNPQGQVDLEVGALSGSIPAGGSVTIRTRGAGNQPFVGWAELNAPPGVGGSVIYAQKIPSLTALQEGTANIVETGTRHFFLPFDNTNGAVTSLALTNPGSAAATITITFRYDDGTSATVPYGSPQLSPRSHQGFALKDRFATTAGKSGTAEFIADTDLYVVAFRFNATGAFTAFGITAK